jgi:hypothetical protein
LSDGRVRADRTTLVAAAVGRSVAQLSLKSARFWVTFIDFLCKTCFTVNR